MRRLHNVVSHPTLAVWLFCRQEIRSGFFSLSFVYVCLPDTKTNWMHLAIHSAYLVFGAAFRWIEFADTYFLHSLNEAAGLVGWRCFIFMWLCCMYVWAVKLGCICWNSIHTYWHSPFTFHAHIEHFKRREGKVKIESLHVGAQTFPPTNRRLIDWQLYVRRKYVSCNIYVNVSLSR